MSKEKPDFKELRRIAKDRPALLRVVDDYEELLEDEGLKGGTVCPECGLRQSHLHLGWLVVPEVGKHNGVCFTKLICRDGCGQITYMVRFEKDADHSIMDTLGDDIWRLFGCEPPTGMGCVSHTGD